MNARTDCPLHRGATNDTEHEEDEDEAAYQALRLCDLDGDEHTTAVILECLHVGAPVTRPADVRPVPTAPACQRKVS